MQKIAIVLGTRPEIIKVGPIIKECINKKKDFFIIHTNQHYDQNLDAIFFENLELPKPKYNLNVGSGTHAETTAKCLVGIEAILLEEKPTIVLAEGDTNTVLAAGLASSKLHITFGHIEAGLRSFYMDMPEEINRILVDHISNFLFVPTIQAKINCLKEGLDKNKIHIVGNTISDAVKQNIQLAKKKSNILSALGIKNKKFCLFTFHREENTVNNQKLRAVLSALEEIIKDNNITIIFPVHPRVKPMLKKIAIPEGIIVIDPLNYFDTLLLIKNSTAVFTDSGGIQEEACILKTPCITLRDNTERPETIFIGANKLAGTEKEPIISAFNEAIKKKPAWGNPYGDGRTAEKIIFIIGAE